MSKQLDQITMYIESGSLNRGVYFIEVTLDILYTSPLLTPYPVEVFTNPWLLDLYPRYFMRSPSYTKHI